MKYSPSRIWQKMKTFCIPMIKIQVFQLSNIHHQLTYYTPFHLVYMYVCTPLPGDSKHVERKPFGSILTQSSRDRCTRASQPSTKNLHTRRLLLLLCQCSFTLLILLAVYSNTYKKHYSYGEKKISLVLLKKSFNLTTYCNIPYLSFHFFVLTNYHV